MPAFNVWDDSQLKNEAGPEADNEVTSVTSVSYSSQFERDRARSLNISDFNRRKI